jgi:peptidoglycan hydrolase-like protein with peptidoglycan-binding domain/DNA-binding XRE family transcriptional regulator
LAKRELMRATIDDGRSGRELLRDLREQVGLTQALLADRAGLSERAISDIERGKKQPREDTLRRLARALQSEANGLAGDAAEAFHKDLTACAARFQAETRRGLANDGRHTRTPAATSPGGDGPPSADREQRSVGSRVIMVVAVASMVGGLLVVGNNLAGRVVPAAAPTATVPAVERATVNPARDALPVLAAGHEGVNVRTVQLLLRHRGHAELALSGWFDADTERAVRTFQGEAGLTADGIVGAQTWDKLLVIVREGSVGDAVIAVQAQLNVKMRAGLEENGRFDAVVRDAVLAFQRGAGITVDGIVGPTTWRHLLAS